MNTLNRSRLVFAASLLLLAAVPALPTFGIGGVGDVVIIAVDQTDAWKWPREKAEWQQVQSLLQSEIEQTKLMIERLGNPGAPASASVGDVARVTEPVGIAVSLQTRQEALDQGSRQFRVGAKGSATLRADNKVDASFSVLGDSYSRDSGRFDFLAQKEGLLARHAQALQNQDRVVESEMSTQRRLLDRLKSATTQADIEAVTAAITASQQRLEIAGQKSVQARDESAALDVQLRIEADRKKEADAEWSEKFVEKLRARALTSLHAQQGENK